MCPVGVSRPCGKPQLDLLLAGDIVTLTLPLEERRRLVTWPDCLTPPPGRVAGSVRSLATQLHATLPPSAPTAVAPSRAPARTARSTEMARAGEIGRKMEGRWVFTAGEVARLQADRDLRARRRSAARRRSSSSSGRLTHADFAAMEQLDQLLESERRLEQTYQLPFRAPQQVATTVHTCQRCGQGLLFLIFGDRARDEEGLRAYGRLMHGAIASQGLPPYVLGTPQGDAALDDTPALLLQVWPTPGEARLVTPRAWDGLPAQLSQAHCATPVPELPVPPEP
jgi:hypothetical protein